IRANDFPRLRKTDGIRGMNPLKRNCNFQTETSFCAYKSTKVPCVLGCKAIFLSNKHNNDRNDKQALIRKQNHWENVTSVLNSAPATPPCSTVDTHTFATACKIVSLIFRLQIMFLSLLFC